MGPEETSFLFKEVFAVLQVARESVMSLPFRENPFAAVETNCRSHRKLHDAGKERNEITELLSTVRFILIYHTRCDIYLSYHLLGNQCGDNDDSRGNRRRFATRGLDTSSFRPCREVRGIRLQIA